MYPWLLHSSPLIIFIFNIRHFILYLHIGSLTHVCFVDVKFGIFENYQNFSDVPYTLTWTSHPLGSTVSFHTIEWYVLKNKSISQDLLPLRNRLKWENTLYLKAVFARNILLMRWIFWCFYILFVNVCSHACR